MNVPKSFSKNTFVAMIAIVLLWVIYQTQQVLLLAFAGVVLAIVFRGAAKALASLMPWLTSSIRYPLSLAAVVLASALLLAGGAYFFVPRVISDIRDLDKDVPAAIEQIKNFPPVAALLDNGEEGLSSEQLNTLASNLSSTAQTVATGMFGAVSGLVIIGFTALFASAQPRVYRDAASSFFPESKRDDCNRVIASCVDSLWGWLKAQGLAMVIVGSLSVTGLFIIDVRYALTLGILAGIFQFVPYVGPIVSAIPALIVALTMSPETTFWVLLLYLGIQFAEGNFITPMVMKQETDLPPLATLLSTILFGVLFGILGAIIATPLAVVLKTLKQELYNKRILSS